MASAAGGGAAAAQATAAQATTATATMKDVSFNTATTTWMYTAWETRLVTDTWVQLQQRVAGPLYYSGPYDTIGPAHLELGQVKAVAKRETDAPGSLRGKSDHPQNADSIQLPFWDHGMHPEFFARLDGEDCDVRLCIYEGGGGGGGGIIAWSEWIGARELVARAAASKPATWDADLETKTKERERNAKKQEEKRRERAWKDLEAVASKLGLVHPWGLSDRDTTLTALQLQHDQQPDSTDTVTRLNTLTKTLKKKHDENRKEEATRKRAEKAAQKAAEDEAWKQQGWREYRPGDRALRCIMALESDFSGWWVRKAQPGQADGKNLVFRTRKDSSSSAKVREIFADDEVALNDLCSDLCKAHTVGAQVEISGQLYADFQGGTCNVIAHEGLDVEVRAVIGGRQKLKETEIENCRNPERNFGVTSLKLYWSKHAPDTYTVSTQIQKPAAVGVATPSAAAKAPRRSDPSDTVSPPSAAGAAAGAAEVVAVEKPATSAAAAATRPGANQSMPVLLSHHQTPASDPWASLRMMDDQPAVVKVKKEHVITLLRGSPREAANQNSGTLLNGKVFVGDSKIAGKGLFGGTCLGKGEIISKFEGRLLEPGDERVHPSHTMPLEQSHAGRELDCFDICADFTDMTKTFLQDPIGTYTGKIYFPISRRGQPSRYGVGLAAFANSTCDTEWLPNCRVPAPVNISVKTAEISAIRVS
jgi:hypothetical protein